MGIFQVNAQLSESTALKKIFGPKFGNYGNHPPPRHDTPPSLCYCSMSMHIPRLILLKSISKYLKRVIFPSVFFYNPLLFQHAERKMRTAE